MGGSFHPRWQGDHAKASACIYLDSLSLNDQHLSKQTEGYVIRQQVCYPMLAHITMLCHCSFACLCSSKMWWGVCVCRLLHLSPLPSLVLYWVLLLLSANAHFRVTSKCFCYRLLFCFFKYWQCKCFSFQLPVIFDGNHFAIFFGFCNLNYVCLAHFNLKLLFGFF